MDIQDNAVNSHVEAGLSPLDPPLDPRLDPPLDPPLDPRLDPSRTPVVRLTKLTPKDIIKVNRMLRFNAARRKKYAEEKAAALQLKTISSKIIEEREEAKKRLEDYLAVVAAEFKQQDGACAASPAPPSEAKSDDESSLDLRLTDSSEDEDNVVMEMPPLERIETEDVYVEDSLLGGDDAVDLAPVHRVDVEERDKDLFLDEVMEEPPRETVERADVKVFDERHGVEEESDLPFLTVLYNEVDSSMTTLVPSWRSGGVAEDDEEDVKPMVQIPEDVLGDYELREVAAPETARVPAIRVRPFAKAVATPTDDSSDVTTRPAVEENVQQAATSVIQYAKSQVKEPPPESAETLPTASPRVRVVSSPSPPARTPPIRPPAATTQTCPPPTNRLPSVSPPAADKQSGTSPVAPGPCVLPPTPSPSPGRSSASSSSPVDPTPGTSSVLPQQLPTQTRPVGTCRPTPSSPPAPDPATATQPGVEPRRIVTLSAEERDRFLDEYAAKIAKSWLMFYKLKTMYDQSVKRGGEYARAQCLDKYRDYQGYLAATKPKLLYFLRALLGVMTRDEMMQRVAHKVKLILMFVLEFTYDIHVYWKFFNAIHEDAGTMLAQSFPALQEVVPPVAEVQPAATPGVPNLQSPPRWISPAPSVSPANATCASQTSQLQTNHVTRTSPTQLETAQTCSSGRQPPAPAPAQNPQQTNPASRLSAAHHEMINPPDNASRQLANNPAQVSQQQNSIQVPKSRPQVVDLTSQRVVPATRNVSPQYESISPASNPDHHAANHQVRSATSISHAQYAAISQSNPNHASVNQPQPVWTSPNQARGNPPQTQEAQMPSRPNNQRQDVTPQAATLPVNHPSNRVLQEVVEFPRPATTIHHLPQSEFRTPVAPMQDRRVPLQSPANNQFPNHGNQQSSVGGVHHGNQAPNVRVQPYGSIDVERQRAMGRYEKLRALMHIRQHSLGNNVQPQQVVHFQPQQAVHVQPQQAVNVPGRTPYSVQNPQLAPVVHPNYITDLPSSHDVTGVQGQPIPPGVVSSIAAAHQRVTEESYVKKLRAAQQVVQGVQRKLDSEIEAFDRGRAPAARIHNEASLVEIQAAIYLIEEEVTSRHARERDALARQQTGSQQQATAVTSELMRELQMPRGYQAGGNVQQQTNVQGSTWAQQQAAQIQTQMSQHQQRQNVPVPGYQQVSSQAVKSVQANARYQQELQRKNLQQLLNQKNAGYVSSQASPNGMFTANEQQAAQYLSHSRHQENQQWQNVQRPPNASQTTLDPAASNRQQISQVLENNRTTEIRALPRQANPQNIDVPNTAHRAPFQPQNRSPNPQQQNSPQTNLANNQSQQPYKQTTHYINNSKSGTIPNRPNQNVGQPKASAQSIQITGYVVMKDGKPAIIAPHELGEIPTYPANSAMLAVTQPPADLAPHAASSAVALPGHDNIQSSYEQQVVNFVRRSAHTAPRRQIQEVSPLVRQVEAQQSRRPDGEAAPTMVPIQRSRQVQGIPTHPASNRLRQMNAPRSDLPPTSPENVRHGGGHRELPPPVATGVVPQTVREDRSPVAPPVVPTTPPTSTSADIVRHDLGRNVDRRDVSPSIAPTGAQTVREDRSPVAPPVVPTTPPTSTSADIVRHDLGRNVDRRDVSPSIAPTGAQRVREDRSPVAPRVVPTTPPTSTSADIVRPDFGRNVVRREVSPSTAATGAPSVREERITAGLTTTSPTATNTDILRHDLSKSITRGRLVQYIANDLLSQKVQKKQNTVDPSPLPVATPSLPSETTQPEPRVLGRHMPSLNQIIDDVIVNSLTSPTATETAERPNVKPKAKRGRPKKDPNETAWPSSKKSKKHKDEKRTQRKHKSSAEKEAAAGPSREVVDAATAHAGKRKSTESDGNPVTKKKLCKTKWFVASEATPDANWKLIEVDVGPIAKRVLPEVETETNGSKMKTQDANDATLSKKLMALSRDVKVAPTLLKVLKQPGMSSSDMSTSAPSTSASSTITSDKSNGTTSSRTKIKKTDQALEDKLQYYLDKKRKEAGFVPSTKAIQLKDFPFGDPNDKRKKKPSSSRNSFSPKTVPLVEVTDDFLSNVSIENICSLRGDDDHSSTVVAEDPVTTQQDLSSIPATTSSLVLSALPEVTARQPEPVHQTPPRTSTVVAEHPVTPQQDVSSIPAKSSLTDLPAPLPEAAARQPEPVHQTPPRTSIVVAEHPVTPQQDVSSIPAKSSLTDLPAPLPEAAARQPEPVHQTPPRTSIVVAEHPVTPQQDESSIPAKSSPTDLPAPLPEAAARQPEPVHQTPPRTSTVVPVTPQQDVSSIPAKSSPTVLPAPPPAAPARQPDPQKTVDEKILEILEEYKTKSTGPQVPAARIKREKVVDVPACTATCVVDDDDDDVVFVSEMKQGSEIIVLDDDDDDDIEEVSQPTAEVADAVVHEVADDVGDHDCVICGLEATGLCAKCMSTYYCSRDCLENDWYNEHEVKCPGNEKPEIAV